MILLLIAAFMFISFFISMYNNDEGQTPLLLSATLTFLTGIFPLIFVPNPKQLSSKEGYLIVVIGWLVVCLYSMLPYILYGGEFSPVNAWFESVSGYTTTGATILTDIEVVPKGILFWRSATHWMGGVGIVLFVLVVLPAMGNARITLSKIEMSPLAKTDFKYRTQKMLRIILSVYLGLTIAEVLLLMVFGMSTFDAVTHTFGTVATGGFSTKNASIAHFNSLGVEVIIIVFMFLSGMHFGILYSFFTLKNNKWYQSSVVRLYFFMMVLGILFVTISTKGNNYSTWGEALRYASFQVVSIATTTGYATCDTTLWPPFSVMILLYFTFQCACAGSTAGGIKVDRLVIFMQSLKRQVLKLQHPNAVIPVKVDNVSIDDETVDSVLLFIVLYILILFINGLLISAMGVDITTAFSASAATISTVGPGFGEVGSAATYAGIPDLGKILLSLNMLLGRLEIYGLLLFFMIRSWK
jgi:trk system potassium uptake protein TrkH